MTDPLLTRIDAFSREVMPRVIAWRRDIHEHPELSNREFRTAKLVEEHLRALGLQVRTGVAHTGVVGLLRGGVDGPVIALRADMDALPVTEEVDLPFASKARDVYNGREVGVMHACGHDAHVAMLMGAAEVLSKLRGELRGSVKFLFQPAEEGAPEGEEGGAELMIREGALDDPRPEAIFGLHVSSKYPTGTFGLCPGPMLAAVDQLRIRVRGRGTHGAYPWRGVDPIVVASQIVLGLQTISSRQLDSTVAPAIVTIGAIHGGVRENIIPEEVSLLGTIRSLDETMQDEIHARVRRTAEKIAESAGATAEVEIRREYPVTKNDPELVERITPMLGRIVGEDRVTKVRPALGAEDFAFYQREIPGVFIQVGTRPPEVSVEKAASNHSPRFFVDESGLENGVRALGALAMLVGVRV